jgi:hypothetical protein
MIAAFTSNRQVIGLSYGASRVIGIGGTARVSLR